MIKAKTCSVGNDKELENLLNSIEEKGATIISVSFIGYNPMSERLYTIVVRK